MGTQATRHSPLTPVPRPMDRLVIRDTPHPRPMDTRADRHILPIPVSVMGIPWLAIPAIALRRTGRLEPSTPSSLLAELPAQNLPQSAAMARVRFHRRRLIATPGFVTATSGGLKGGRS
jgi:hypothetical protein